MDQSEEIELLKKRVEELEKIVSIMLKADKRLNSVVKRKNIPQLKNNIANDFAFSDDCWKIICLNACSELSQYALLKVNKKFSIWITDEYKSRETLLNKNSKYMLDCDDIKELYIGVSTGQWSKLKRLKKRNSYSGLLDMYMNDFYDIACNKRFFDICTLIYINAPIGKRIVMLRDTISRNEIAFAKYLINRNLVIRLCRDIKIEFEIFKVLCEILFEMKHKIYIKKLIEFATKTYEFDETFLIITLLRPPVTVLNECGHNAEKYIRPYNQYLLQ